MLSATLIILIIFGTSLALPPSKTKEYRNYEYNRQTDAFYKLHIETVSWRHASDTCKVEGATIMLPINKQDIMQLHGMFKRFPDIGEYVYVGNDEQIHTSAEETPIIDLTTSSDEERNRPWNRDCDVVTRDGEIETTGCYNRHPFICKVNAQDAPYDEQCDVYTTGYKYYENVKSCYNMPHRALTWDQAYAECRAEKAHLLILNSEEESRTIKQMLETRPVINDAHTNYFFYAGIRANRPTDGSQRVFRTVFNETLEEAGYSGWSTGEPNNHQDTEYCGTVFSNNGKYNDVDCSNKYGFICEKEVTPK